MLLDNCDSWWQVKQWLQDGKDVRLGDWKAADIEILNTFQLLTAKPVVYLVCCYVYLLNKLFSQLSWIFSNFFSFDKNISPSGLHNIVFLLINLFLLSMLYRLTWMRKTTRGRRTSFYQKFMHGMSSFKMQVFVCNFVLLFYICLQSFIEWWLMSYTVHIKRVKPGWFMWGSKLINRLGWRH